MGSYLPSTADEREQMLATLGVSSLEELYASIPAHERVGELDIPHGLSELELRSEIEALANKNTVFPSIFRGAGAYHRYIPSLVKTVMSREEFVTSYTPYQAEISQGVLQSIFEYQSMVCELTGLDVSNASLYDGASAAAEAVFMCQDRRRSNIVLSATTNPQIIETIQTYCTGRNVELTVVPAKNGATDKEAFAAVLDNKTACALFQQPNYYGVLEDARDLVEIIHAAGAKAIMSVEPISLGVLASPGELGADICVAEGQPLGLPLSFGGPYLGIITCTKALMRKLPGRIVGQTQDAQGNRVFVLTLQAREQHIRREKASSNVCSNQALCALGAGVYLSCMGPDGLKQAALLGHAKAHYLAEQLCALDGYKIAFDQPFFNEFTLACPVDPSRIEAHLAKHGILAGLPLGKTSMLWCATEMNSKEQIDRVVELLAEVK